MSKVVVRKNLNRWFKEKWVDVSRTGKDGKHPPCGRKKAKKGSKGYPKCRPSVKVSSKTPKTSGQMTSGQKRAATKRKRSKKQGVGGKPTIVKQEVPFADANHPVSMTEVSNLMLGDAPQQCTIQDCPNPEAPPVVRARYRNPIGSQDYTHHMCEDCAHRHELGYMVQKGEPIEIAFNIIKQEDYPLAAMAEDERQLPTPMYTKKPRLTHPGFSRTDVFQVPTGVGIPLATAAPRLTRNVGGHQVTHPDDIGEARHQVPHVMTQGVHQGPKIYRMPTFFGLPLYQEHDPENPNSLFSTGEPMDLAFRLLKEFDETGAGMYQTELGEHHIDFPSSQGPAVLFHGTTGDNAMQIMGGQGIQNPDPNYRTMTTNPSEAATYAIQRAGQARHTPINQSRPSMVAVRQGALDAGFGNYIGQSHGLKNIGDYEGAQHSGGNIPRQFLTRMPMSQVDLTQTMQGRDNRQDIIDRNMAYPLESQVSRDRRAQQRKDKERQLQAPPKDLSRRRRWMRSKAF